MFVPEFDWLPGIYKGIHLSFIASKTASSDEHSVDSVDKEGARNKVGGWTTVVFTSLYGQTTQVFWGSLDFVHQQYDMYDNSPSWNKRPFQQLTVTRSSTLPQDP